MEQKGDLVKEIKKSSEIIAKIRAETGKALVGQHEIVDRLIMALISDGHVLIEGVPGIAKTLAVRALAKITGCEMKRIQFTVDLLPTDIVGITTYHPNKGFMTEKGPIFANFIIADEINRSPPKTQSAMIEAMQEKQVTLGKKDYTLPKPFFVMATQNPIEQSGVYPLPEAQIDRFLFKIIMTYPKKEEEFLVMEQNMTLKNFDDFNLKSVTTTNELIKMQQLAKQVYLDDKIKNYILDIIQATRTKDFKYGEYIEYGSSPRATIALFMTSKARALINGRSFVIPKDVKESAHDVLRHRIILSYKAEIQKITSDKVIDEIIHKVAH
jgi:MoxR-like ATPase